jgi:hypothetical protein
MPPLRELLVHDPVVPEVPEPQDVAMLHAPVDSYFPTEVQLSQQVALEAPGPQPVLPAPHPILDRHLPLAQRFEFLRRHCFAHPMPSTWHGHERWQNLLGAEACGFLCGAAW